MTHSFSALNRVDLLNAITSVFPAASPRDVMPIIGNFSQLIRYLAEVNDITHIEALETFETRVPLALPQASLDAA